MVQEPRTRRALRDLLPATLATGAAGLVVSMLVGGTAQGIRSALDPADARDVPTYSAAPAIDPHRDRVTVRVRPALPGPLGVVSFLDLAGAVSGMSPASTIETTVRGVLLDRDPPPEPGAAAPADTPVAPVSAEPPAAVTPAAAVAEGTVGPTEPRRRPKSKGRDRVTAPTVLAASDQRVALDAGPTTDEDGEPATEGKHPNDAKDRVKHGHEPSPNGPPPHAPAHGYRVR